MAKKQDLPNCKSTSHSVGEIPWDKYDDVSVWEDGCQCFPFVENSLGMLTSNRHNGNGCTALHGALLERDMEAIGAALSAGASPHIGLEGQPPLHMAVAVGAFPGYEPVAAQAVQVLLRAGALLNQRDMAGNTPLHTASRLGLLDTVNVLLNTKGCLIHAKENNGRSALHLAAGFGSEKLVKALLKANADPNATDLWDQTPLHFAIQRGHLPVAKALLDAGSNPKMTDKMGRSAESLYDTDQTDPEAPKPRQRAFLFHPDCESHPGTGRRLKCLYHPKYGVLHTKEFKNVEWVQPRQKVMISDILRVHEYEYVKKVESLCASLDSPSQSLCSHSYKACVAAASTVLEAVDRVVGGGNRSAFCAVSPSGHLIGDSGAMDAHFSGLLNVVAIGAAYACNRYRGDVKKVAIVDFDAQPATGTEEILWNLIPSFQQTAVDAPEYQGPISLTKFKPWVDENDSENVLLVSSQVINWNEEPMVELVPDEISAVTAPDFSHLTAGSVKEADMIVNLDLDRLDSRPKSCSRLQFRQAYREGVLPRLVEFDPDLVLVSAGFSNHEGDEGHIGSMLLEEDFEWLTEQIIKVSNKCCDGRVVTVLEGGRQAEGWSASVLARSVASHCRAIINTKPSERWDAEKAKNEGAVEEKIFEERWTFAAAQAVQAQIRGCIHRWRWPVIRKRIIALQCCIRRWKCKRAYQYILRCITKAQASYRGYKIRQAASLSHALKAILLIQRIWRRALARSDYFWRQRARRIDLNFDLRCKQLFVANRAELYNIFQCYMDQPRKAIMRSDAMLFAVNFKLVPTFVTRKQFEDLIDDIVEILNLDPVNKENKIEQSTAPLNYIGFLKMLLLTAKASLEKLKAKVAIAERLSEMFAYMDSSGGKQKMGGDLHRNAFSKGDMVYLDNAAKLPDPNSARAFDLDVWLQETHIQKKRSFRRQASGGSSDGGSPRVSRGSYPAPQSGSPRLSRRSPPSCGSGSPQIRKHLSTGQMPNKIQDSFKKESMLTPATSVPNCSLKASDQPHGCRSKALKSSRSEGSMIPRSPYRSPIKKSLSASASKSSPSQIPKGKSPTRKARTQQQQST